MSAQFDLIRIIHEHLFTEQSVLEVGEPMLAGEAAKLAVVTTDSPGGLEIVVTVPSQNTQESAENAARRMASELTGLRARIVQNAPDRFKPSYGQVVNFDEYPMRYVHELEQLVMHLREDLAKLTG